MKRVPWDLLAAAALYAVLRLLVLHTAFDQTAMPMYELFPMGTMAELAREGVDLPLAYLYDNAAGQILFGFVTRPFFALFGPSYLALKLVPFTLGLGTLFLLWTFLRANFGPRAAAIGAFLFALAPTTLFKYSLMNSGNHFENLFFVLFACVATYRFLRAGERWALFASGFASGFALFVFLGALIPVGLLLGLAVGVRGLRQALRDLPVALLGFGLGLAPLVLVNLATGARGLGFLQSKFAEIDERASGSVLERAGEFLTRHLLDCGVYEPLAGIPGAVLGALFLAAFAVAWLASAPSAARGVGGLLLGLGKDATGASARFQAARCVPLLLYLPLAALAYGVSNFRIGGHGPPIVVAGYRYFLPHLLFALLLVAIVAERWIERGGARRLAGLALAGVPLFAGLANASIVDWTFAKSGLGTHYAGYNLAQVGRALIAGRNALTEAAIQAHVARFPPLLRHRVVTSIGFNRGTLQIEELRERAGHPGADPEWRLDLPRLCAGWPEEHALDLARGLGVALRFTCGGSPKGLAEMRRVLEAVLADAPVLGPGVAEGACLPPGTEPLESRTAQLLGTNAALRDAVDGTLREHVLRGTGLLVGRLRVRGIASERPRLDEWIAASAGSEAFFLGLGQGLADGGDAPLPPDRAGITIAPGDVGALERGFRFGVARIARP
ncbi:MAG: glycosyltransferase family 39 protein [Planctomycetes bacterium]|nr:glycosyltransferase family 39 protein [Planctomycetota bacterium]